MVLHQAFRARRVRKTGIGGKVRHGVTSGVSCETSVNKHVTPHLHRESRIVSYRIVSEPIVDHLISHNFISRRAAPLRSVPRRAITSRHITITSRSRHVTTEDPPRA